jgi:hypothetical protein
VASEEIKTTKIITQEINELKETVDKIRYNELVHMEKRLVNLESKARTPLTTLYLIVAFAIFVGFVAVISLPESIGWSVAGIAGLIIILAGLAIFKIITTKS